MYKMGWKTSAVLAALSFLGVGSLAYFLFRKNDNDDDYLICKLTKPLEVKVPKDSVGIVIGRGGNTLKEIELKSDTTIRVVDDGGSDYKKFIIRGTTECAQLAECLIHEIIVGQPLIETSEMQVPIECCGRLVGKGGDSIRMISRSSNAKLLLESRESFEGSNTRKLIIKGTAEQIALAKDLVEQKIEEEMEYRKSMERNRPPRFRRKYLFQARREQEVELNTHKERILTRVGHGIIEVFVSAVKSPSRFWLQMAGPTTVELDRLNEQMTDYYSKMENKALHQLHDVQCGNIVAAPFLFDDKWYRAEVVEVRENDVSLYYVDYGDYFTCNKENVYELNTEFLKLKHQAIECALAKVKPRNGEWTTEAIDFFSELTHVAMWKPLVAKVHSYKHKPTRFNREGSPVPCLELFDIERGTPINVIEEMVSKGFADWAESPEKASRGRRN